MILIIMLMCFLFCVLFCSKNIIMTVLATNLCTLSCTLKPHPIYMVIQSNFMIHSTMSTTPTIIIILIFETNNISNTLGYSQRSKWHQNLSHTPRFKPDNARYTSFSNGCQQFIHHYMQLVYVFLFSNHYFSLKLILISRIDKGGINYFSKIRLYWPLPVLKETQKHPLI